MDGNDALNNYFSEYFGVSRQTLDKYGAFDISLVADLPLFIDPFLLFQSKKPEYQQLHHNIINYLAYLRDLSIDHTVDFGKLQSLFYFSEVQQNYLGFSFMGNRGHGLGYDFAKNLNLNLSKIFTSFGSETITKGTHLEKLCLISRGVGRDTISDFVTNLIKEYLLNYTQEFASKYIQDEKLIQDFAVKKVRFNYQLGRWDSDNYRLPLFNGDLVLLTPKDILTREENWISRGDYVSGIYTIVEASPNIQLRADLEEYLTKTLSKKPKREEFEKAVSDFTRMHPELIDYYIRSKEDNGEKAVERSAIYVSESEKFFVNQFGDFAQFLFQNTAFYKLGHRTKDETYQRIMFLKDAIENKGCWKIFYDGDKPIKREEDVHVLFRLVWFGTPFDVSREVNDGAGPADFKVSQGSKDKTLVEFKLASNTHIKENLQKQLELYKKASDAPFGYKVIVYFSVEEFQRVRKILDELGMSNDPNIILVDAMPKVSASKA